MSGVTAAIDSLGLEIIIPALLLLVAVLPFLLNANRNQALGLLAAPFLLALGLGYLKYQADHTAAASEGELLRATPPKFGSARTPTPAMLTPPRRLVGPVIPVSTIAGTKATIAR